MVLKTLLAVVTHVVLTFTFPSFNALSCETDSATPLDDLATVHVHWWPRYANQGSVIYSASSVGLQGQRGSIGVDVEGEGVLYVTTKDFAGNESCGGKYYVVAFTTDVLPTPRDQKEPVFWFDVAGRKSTEEPTTPGVYFRVQGKSKQKHIVLR